MLSDKLKADLDLLARYRRNLPAQLREAILAARGEGATWPEIAAALEMHPDAVRKLVAR